MSGKKRGSAGAYPRGHGRGAIVALALLDQETREESVIENLRGIMKFIRAAGRKFWENGQRARPSGGWLSPPFGGKYEEMPDWLRMAYAGDVNIALRSYLNLYVAEET